MDPVFLYKRTKIASPTAASAAATAMMHITMNIGAIGSTEGDKGKINSPEHDLYAQKHNNSVFAGDHPAAAYCKKYRR